LIVIAAILSLIYFIFVTGDPFAGANFPVFLLLTLAYLFTTVLYVLTLPAGDHVTSRPLRPAVPKGPRGPVKPAILYSLCLLVSLAVTGAIVLTSRGLLELLPSLVSVGLLLDFGFFFLVTFSVFIDAVFALRAVGKLESRLLVPFAAQGAAFLFWNYFVGPSCLLVALELLFLLNNIVAAVFVFSGFFVFSWFFWSKLVPRLPRIS